MLLISGQGEFETGLFSKLKLTANPKAAGLPSRAEKTKLTENNVHLILSVHSEQALAHIVLVL